MYKKFVQNVSIRDDKTQTQLPNKADVSLVNYCSKHFLKNHIYDISFTIKIKDHKISRRIYIGDKIDLNIFSKVILELFDFSGKSWRIKFPYFHLTATPNDNQIIFETHNTKKSYFIYLVYLEKLNLNLNDEFLFIYDVFNEKWVIECKIESKVNVKEIIDKVYKSQKDKDLAFLKLKSLFRPILISGENQPPPEGLGGPQDFVKLLKFKYDQYHPTTLKYMEYYNELNKDDSEDMDDDEDDEEYGQKSKIKIKENKIAGIVNINKYLYDFDFEYVQDSLGTINFLKCYKVISEKDKLFALNIENPFESSKLSNETYIDDEYEDEDEYDDDMIDELENESKNDINESGIKGNSHYHNSFRRK
jgi:hypothetical protein